MVASSPPSAAKQRVQIASLGRDLNPALIGESMQISAAALPDNLHDGVAVTCDEHYGTHERHRLDVYTSTALLPRSDRSVVVYVHGGGFAVGSKGDDGTPFYGNIGAWAASNDYVAVIINYRLTPEASWPSGAQDIALALRWVNENVARFGGCPERVFLVGQSAGAMHVADYIAHPELHDANVSPLAGGIIVSCIYDLGSAEDKPIHRAYWGEDIESWPAKSSLDGIVASDLPLMLTVAEFDEPQFQDQAAGLVSTWRERRGTYPPMHYLYGQNHLTSVYAIGSEYDSLGPLMVRFISGTA